MSALTSFTAAERSLFLRLNALSFLLLGSYGIAQPTCQSLFVSAYGAGGLPWAWLGVTVLSVVSVVTVERLSARLPLWQVLRVAAAASAGVLAALLFVDGAGAPHVMFVLYLWKDVYIVVLVELFWTFANLVFAAGQARTAYGWFCATGTIGGMAGSFFAAKMATRWGTHQVLWTTVPWLVVAACMASAARRHAHGAAAAAAAPRPAWREAPTFLRRSPFVGWLILLVGVVQASMTVMDFQFNQAAARFTEDTDALTRLMGQVQGSINGASLVLQIATGPILRVFGLASTLVAIPVTLLATLAAFVFVPGLAPIIAAKVVGKSADYSLFRAAKEMLYIPLSYTEKTFGKALVDILVYRVAKGGVSLVLLALVGLHSGQAIGWVSLLLCGLWIWVTGRLLRVYRLLPVVQNEAPRLGWLAVLSLGAGLWAAPGTAGATGEDPTGVGPSFTKPDLFVHPAGADLSAQRLDCEVFGWNKTLTEVALVGSDIARGPRGRHRGEVYMLVHRVADGKLLHNVITHNVTHPDLPHNPIPLDDVRDFTWTIENPYLAMWPVRPQHRRPRQGMAVRALSTSVPAAGDAGLCTPYIGAALSWRGGHRLASFTAADMTVSCSVLQHGDERVYWGSDDTAAVMMRFDYNNLPNNEKSARFVQSLLWRQAVVPRVALEGELHSHEGLAEIVASMPWAEVDHRELRVGNPLARALLRVTAGPAGLPLAYHLKGTVLAGHAEVAAEVISLPADAAAPATQPRPAAAPSPPSRANSGRRPARKRGLAWPAQAGHSPRAQPPPAGPSVRLLLGDPSWRPPPPPDPDHPGAGGPPRVAPRKEEAEHGDFIDSWQPP